MASQIAIKQLGSNGGGFFNANSAHPFENPTALTNLIENWAILVIPFGLAFTYGQMVGDRRQGWAVFAIMATVWLFAAVTTTALQTAGNTALGDLGIAQIATAEQGGGSMEGTEVRLGSAACGLWAASTTGTSNGSVNCMHDSMVPLAGGIALTHISLGEVSPGGVGVGLNGLLIFSVLAVFIAGLMVGRTPEYLGKKIQANEIKLVALYLLAMPLVMLGFGAASVLIEGAVAAANDTGPHGLTEILYAYASGANNNGSAFAGLGASTVWYDTTIGFSMLVGRSPADHPGSGSRRLPRRQRAPPRDRRDDADPHTSVRGAGRRGRGDRRRAHLLPGTGAGALRGAPVDRGERHMSASGPTSPSVSRRRGSASVLDRAVVVPALVSSLRKLDRARPGVQSGDVPRAGGELPDHLALHP